MADIKKLFPGNPLQEDASEKSQEYVVITVDVCIKNKKGNIVSLYRSPSQTTGEFDLFMLNLEKPIDLIFTNQLNLVKDSGIHLILESKCHHQIIYSKLKLKIEYRPPYTRKIQDYNRAETDLNTVGNI